MKTARRLMIALTVTLLALALSAQAEFTAAAPGQPLPDFTVTTIDGGTFTLSEVLKEKKAVLVNLWATWCGPCRMEFPFMEAAYEQYSDRVEVIALSVEPTDDAGKLKDYAEAEGLTFPIGSAIGTHLTQTIVTSGIPVSVLVDRFGNISLIEVGAQTSADAFVNAFERLTSDDYTETVVLEGFPPSRPSKEEGVEGWLADAPFSLTDSPDEAVWNFVPGEEDGRSFIAAANAGKANSAAEVRITAEAEEGDALAFDYRVSCEKGFDRASLLLNGRAVRRFTGESDWTGYVLALEAGHNEVSIRYEKDDMTDAGEDTIQLSSFRLLMGEEAREALAAQPVYPFAEETFLTLVSEGAREIVFEPGEAGSIDDVFGAPCRCFILNAGEASFTAGVSPEILPDDIVFASNYRNQNFTWDAWDILEGPFTSPVDSLETTGYYYTCVYDFLTEEYRVAHYYVLFADEANADIMKLQLAAQGLATGYSFVDGGAEGAAE